MKKLKDSVLPRHAGVGKCSPARSCVSRPSGRRECRGAIFPQLSKVRKKPLANQRIQQIPGAAIESEYESLRLLHLNRPPQTRFSSLTTETFRCSAPSGAICELNWNLL